MKSFFIFVLCSFLSTQLFSSTEDYPDFVEEVYLTEQEALNKVFPKVDRVEKETISLTSGQKLRIERRLGWRLNRDSFVVYHGYRDKEKKGYAVITEEIGKYKPITFIVKVTPRIKVEAVEVLVYREPRGSEVRKKRFLYQLKGKTVKSPLRINRDMINITGATLSVRAMAAGVKKVLFLIDEVYGKNSQ